MFHVGIKSGAYGDDIVRLTFLFQTNHYNLSRIQLETLETLAPGRAPTAPPLSPSSVRKMNRSRGEEMMEEEEEEEEEGEGEGDRTGGGDEMADQSE